MSDFAERLEKELYRRYQECPATVTPDTILLAVCNAVAAARLTPEKAAEALGCKLTDRAADQPDEGR